MLSVPYLSERGGGRGLGPRQLRIYPPTSFEGRIVTWVTLTLPSSSSCTSRFFRIAASCPSAALPPSRFHGGRGALDGQATKYHGESLDCVICVSAGVFSSRIGNQFFWRLRHDRLLTLFLGETQKPPGPSPSSQQPPSPRR
ncbi:hypothetical protein CGRA01v4_13275 [Colletotrichum graminicola]|nr:hypothetical protein CGRA01v4_13275 [Colletotrichum graminicola]